MTNEKQTQKQEAYLGDVIVDTGRLVIGDPVHLEDGLEQLTCEDWEVDNRGTPLEESDNGIANVHEVLGECIAIEDTGLGDGKFPVYATYENGVCTEVRIVFMENGRHLLNGPLPVKRSEGVRAVMGVVDIDGTRKEYTIDGRLIIEG